MKNVFVFLALWLTATAVSAQQRSMDDMQKIAVAHLTSYKSNSSLKSINTSLSSVKLVAMSSSISQLATPSHEAFAVFAPEVGSGFVIVSADEKMPAVLAFCNDKDFDSSDNPALTNLLDSYIAASEAISSGKAIPKAVFGNAQNVKGADASRSKAPLLGNISYAQNAPYNMLCPVYNNTPTKTGCVATAMAQLMKYYEHPADGTGNISYTTKTNGINVDWDLASTPFNWNSILDTYPPAYSNPDETLNITSDKPCFHIFGDDGGGLAYDESRPSMLNVMNIYNESGETLSGYMQFILKNSEGTFRHAGSTYQFSNLENNYGWKSLRLTPALPQDLADGEYQLYIGYTTDQTNYNIAYNETTSAPYYVSVVKNGRNFTCLQHEFPCQASVTEMNSVANLMAACGAAIQSDYKTDNTSANAKSAWIASNTYFDYDTDMTFVTNEMISTDGMYTEAKNILDNEYIIPVSGRTETNNGHSFLIDGYDFTGESPMFHINWGWNGSSNGYFLLTQMQPSEAGTGGTTKSYSYSYTLYKNVFPENNIADGVSLMSKHVKVSKTVMSPGEGFALEVDTITNCCLAKPLDAKFYCALDNGSGTVYVFASLTTFADKNLAAGYTRNGIYKWASVTVPSQIPEGTYHVVLISDDKDHFYCIDNPEITIGDNAAIHEIEADDSGDNAANTYDLSGRRTDVNKNGVIIQDGKKIIVHKP